MAWNDPAGAQAVSSLPEPPTRDGRRRARIATGLLVLVLGTAGATACLVAAVLTANPCGAFSDGCAEYGQTSEIAVVLIYGMVLGAIVALAGVVAMIVGLMTPKH